ncbi:MAG TPA: TOBE-like domain-containing protein, partial [Cyanophyceae cyanobacterium]
PFVMSFIGPVNVLPSNSQIFQQAGFDSAHPEIFLRPHDVLVETKPNGVTAPARVSRLIHLGWEVQAELVLDDGQVVMANLSREQFNKLQLEPQQRVYVKPKDAKAFPLSYSI